MSDKELDLLFKQQFETFEPEVSPGLWNSIEEEIGEGKKAGRKFPVAWMAAASVVVILSASIWLMQSHKPGMKLRGTGNNQFAVTKPVLKKAPAEKADAVSPVLTAEQPVLTISKAAEEPVFSRMAEQPAEDNVAGPVNDKSEPQVVAAVQAHGETPEEHDAHVPKGVSSVDLRTTFRTNTQVTAVPVLASVADIVNDEQPKKKINSISGLVNYVVGKVDRRENKLIEMKDGDEGAEVTGINLGLFKLKSKDNTVKTTNIPSTINK